MFEVEVGHLGVGWERCLKLKLAILELVWKYFEVEAGHFEVGRGKWLKLKLAILTLARQAGQARQARPGRPGQARPGQASQLDRQPCQASPTSQAKSAH